MYFITSKAADLICPPSADNNEFKESPIEPALTYISVILHDDSACHDSINLQDMTDQDWMLINVRATDT